MNLERVVFGFFIILAIILTMTLNMSSVLGARCTACGSSST